MADVLLKIEEGPGVRKQVPKKVDDFLELARKRFHTVSETEATLREEQYEDKRFRASEQWPDEIKADRQQDGRPCLTINRLPQFLRHVTNQARASRPAIQVHPVDSFGDIETAETLQGLVRHVETRSDADVAYAVGAENAAEIGRGYWRIVTEWASDTSFQQELRIKRIRNPFTVYMDPSYSEFDGRDARFCFVVQDIPKELYRQTYGDVSLDSLTEFHSIGDQGEEWMPEGKVRIAEYFYVDMVDEKVIALLLPNGEIEGIAETQLEALIAQGAVVQGQPVANLQRLGERENKRREVRHAVINGNEILVGNKDKTSGQMWPGKWIPIIPIIGDEIDVNGKVDYRGIVRDARDPQRMFNYWESALTESIALSPKSPFIIAKGQLEGLEGKWNTANTRNWPYLEYHPVDSAGNTVGPPQRNSAEPPIQALIAATQQADFDLKAVTGFHDPSLGNLSANERSGKAILALQKQGEMANSHYLDNLSRAIRFTGRQLVDLIPKVYDTPRILRILGEDDQPRTVMVGSRQEQMPKEAPKGVEAIYDISVGEYDVAVSVGPSFQSRRQEVNEMVTKFVEAYPDAFPVVGDLLVASSELPIGRKVAKRLKNWAMKQGVLPPEMEDGEEMPPEAVAQIEALTSQLEQAQQAMQEMQQQIQVDATKAQADAQMKSAELQSKEKIAQLQASVDVAIAELKAANDATRNDVDLAKTQMIESNKKVLATMNAIASKEQNQQTIESRKKSEGSQRSGQRANSGRTRGSNGARS